MEGEERERGRESVSDAYVMDITTTTDGREKGVEGRGPHPLMDHIYMYVYIYETVRVSE